VHTANRHLHSSGERNGAQRRTKVSFGKTMMQAFELLQLTKRNILGFSNVVRGQEIEPVALDIMLAWRH